MEFQSGYIAIVGRPNAGKSTLLNAIMNEKIAIMSDKPNTTRNNIAGILTREDVQYVFVDTPGIHKPQQHLGRVLNKNAYTAMEDCDVIGWIVDGSKSFGPGDQFILDRIKGLHKPVVLLVNKIDLLPREKMMATLLKWQQAYDFNDIVPLSAKTKDNVEEVLHVFKGYLPEGPAMYPEYMKSDHDVNFQICEIIREKILFKTHDEIPHSIAILLDHKEETENAIDIQATVIVDRDSQKGILIGKQARMIKSIRLDAQTELKRKFNKSVHLDLFVRVQKNWRNQQQKIKEFGLDELEHGIDH